MRIGKVARWGRLWGMRSPGPPWAWWLAASGAAALSYEMIWLRRLSLWLGGTTVAASVTLAGFMAGLALGSAAVDFVRRHPHPGAIRLYALCEATAAAWALAFPALLALARSATLDLPLPVQLAAAFVLLLPPAAALGATWPLLAGPRPPTEAALLYVANTAGAVGGVLITTFVALPALGVRGSEVAAAVLGLLVAAWAYQHRRVRAPGAPAPALVPAPHPSPPVVPRPLLWLAAAAAGVSALGLEVVWFRVAAVGLGATVQSQGWVLAVFLATLAAGAALGRRWPGDPRRGLAGGLLALGLLALGGAFLWGQLPFVVAGLYRLAGPPAMLPGTALVAALGMAGAPAASGLAFSNAIRCLGAELADRAGTLYALNTAGAILGSLAAGLWAVPTLGLTGAVCLFALLAVGIGALVARSPLAALAGILLALALPGWDERLYAVGVHIRISDFADPSPRAVRQFAREGWRLLHYAHGPTAAVAVGESERTGNRWMSINGKVDASTGDDMPTQLLSGQIPVRLVDDPHEVLVVGLASGVTAGAVLDEPGVRSLVVVEIEPEVVRASRYFDHVSGAPLDDPRTTLIADDARAYLTRRHERFDVIVSEPSNPWITGVSSLFTLEYWALVRARLRPGGVACQWLQLYGIGPAEFRGLLRTFLHVFPDAVMVETIPGSDVLLLGGTGGRLPDGLDVSAPIGPGALRALAGAGWLNTDDRPRVEWAAPRWLHYDTGPVNARMLEVARGGAP